MDITMTFPAGLYGLLALPLVLALHLVRSRSRRLPVSSLALWNFLSPQLTGSSARRLPLTWLLLVDLLIAAFLSLALAGPQLDLNRTVREGRHLILVLDTSTSMGARDEDPSRLLAALEELRETASSAAAQDALTVIVFNKAAATAADSRDPDFASDWEALQSVQAGGRGANLPAALALARAARDPDLPAEVHIFTDAAFESPDLPAMDLPLRWHLFGSSEGNQAVLALSGVPLSTLRFQVFARFANFSAEAIEREYVLMGDGQELARGEITLEAESSITQSWELVGSVDSLSLVLEGADALQADDAAFTAVPAPGGSSAAVQQVSVALVADQPGPLLRALEAVPDALVQVIPPDEYLPGSPFDLVVFKDYLPDRWPGGSVFVVQPPPDSELLGPATDRPVAELPVPIPDPLLEDVDFTGVRWSGVYDLERPQLDLDGILQAGSTPLILRGQTGLTDLVILLVPLSGPDGSPTAFARHPAFPVLVANLVQDAAGLQLPEQIHAGEALKLPSGTRYPEVRIARPDGAEAVFGLPRPVRWEETELPGFYRMIVTNLDGLEQVFSIGVIGGDLSESDIAPRTWPAGVETPALPEATTEQPVSLTPWLVAFAAALFLLEAWLAWR